MPPITRTIAVETPLGDALRFYRMTGHEELGRIFSFELELLGEEDEVSFADVIGQPITVKLLLREGQWRYFHGVVTRLANLGGHGRLTRFGATVRPELWLLTKKTDCRIFQQQTAVEIIKAVLREHGLTFSESLGGDFRRREYCVQYRESDFHFVSRLMEEEGIYYFFDHEQSKHTMVLADSYGAHATVSGYEEVPFYPPGDEHTRRDRDHIKAWIAAEQLEPGACVLADYDFKRPNANLEVKLVSGNPLARPALEVYDYPGVYVESADGEGYVRNRLEALYAGQATVRAEGDVRGLGPGHLFALTNHPRADQNREHLVVSAKYELAVDSGVSRESEDELVCRCALSVIDGQRPFRPARTTHKAVIQGPQTATVVGKSNEEIWTDEHGRIKLQFHWDRLGQWDENSSCWVRVAQIWAGSGWGGIHIPRIGQEVVVDFLEGDPDRPLVTGCVYNGNNRPPYALPANQTQSGIKSRSSKGGNAGNRNEIRFEDKKGSEELSVHAEKDQKEQVNNNLNTNVGAAHSHTVGADQTITVNQSRTKTIAVDETNTIGSNRTETVGANETITVGANRTETVGGSESLTVAKMRTHTVGINETVAIGAAQEVAVGGLRSVTVGGIQSIDVGVNHSVNVGGSHDLDVGKNRSTSVGKDDSLKVKKKLVIDAGDEITLKTGSASIVMKKDGTITIKGKDITIKGSGKINIKASKDVTIKGSKIGQN